MKVPPYVVHALKYSVFRGLLMSATLVIPVTGIKWGAAHRHFPWHHFFEKAIFLGFRPDSSIWVESFAFHVPWQEKSSVIACILFSVYTNFQLAFNIRYEPEPETDDTLQEKSEARSKIIIIWTFWQKPEQVFLAGSYLFLFLYVAACAVCERTGIGMVSSFGNDELATIYRDAGLALLLVVLTLQTRFLTKMASFNGMLTREDIAHAYKYLVMALGALAMTFASWLPLFALPGALIMTRFAFLQMKEHEDRTEFLKEIEQTRASAERSQGL